MTQTPKNTDLDLFSTAVSFAVGTLLLTFFIDALMADVWLGMGGLDYEFHPLSGLFGGMIFASVSLSRTPGSAGTAYTLNLLSIIGMGLILIGRILQENGVPLAILDVIAGSTGETHISLATNSFLFLIAVMRSRTAERHVHPWILGSGYTVLLCVALLQLQGQLSAEMELVFYGVSLESAMLFVGLTVLAMLSSSSSAMFIRPGHARSNTLVVTIILLSILTSIGAFRTLGISLPHPAMLLILAGAVALLIRQIQIFEGTSIRTGNLGNKRNAAKLYATRLVGQPPQLHGLNLLARYLIWTIYGPAGIAQAANFAVVAFVTSCFTTWVHHTFPTVPSINFSYMALAWCFIFRSPGSWLGLGAIAFCAMEAANLIFDAPMAMVAVENATTLIGAAIVAKAIVRALSVEKAHGKFTMNFPKPRDLTVVIGFLYLVGFLVGLVQETIYVALNGTPLFHGEALHISEFLLGTSILAFILMGATMELVVGLYPYRVHNARTYLIAAVSWSIVYISTEPGLSPFLPDSLMFALPMMMVVFLPSMMTAGMVFLVGAMIYYFHILLEAPWVLETMDHYEAVGTIILTATMNTWLFSGRYMLRQRDRELRGLVRHGPAKLITLTRECTIHSCSENMAELLGMPSQMTLGQTLIAVMQMPDKSYEEIHNAICNPRKDFVTFEQEITTQKGVNHHLKFSVRRVHETSLPYRFILSVEEISGAERMERLLVPLFSRMPAEIVVFGQTTDAIYYMSDKFAQHFKRYTNAPLDKDWSGMTYGKLIDGNISQQFYRHDQELRDLVSGMGQATETHVLQLRVGFEDIRYVKREAVCVDMNMEEPLIVCTYSDITHEIHSRRKLESLIYQDDLTGIMSRRGFLREARDGNRTNDMALICLDIDHFKSVNDTFGHEVGDEVLRRIGLALDELQDIYTFAARLGGEEFILCCPWTTWKDIYDFVDYLRIAIGNIEVETDNITLKRTASFGYAKLSQEDRLAEVMTWADRALNVAKASGRNKAIAADEAFRQAQNDKGVLITMEEVSEAMERGEICYFLQPICHAETRRVRGFEALIRWVRKDGEVVPPFKFLSQFLAVTRHSHDCELTRRMRTELVQYTRQFPGSYIAFNLSLENLAFEGAGLFYNEFFQMISDEGHTVVIEISEQSIRQRLDMKCVAEELRVLRNHGVRIALDDFGLEASNLDRLITLPIDIVKIDKKLVDNVNEDFKSVAVIQAVVDMAAKLGIDVVAEGIETNIQREALMQIGVHYHQGYHYARALAGRDLHQLLAV